MCGRYTVIKHDQIVRVFFNVTIPANLRLIARFNIAPSQQIPVIANNSSQLQMFRWGLIPSWAKDEKIGNRLINARAETLADKPSFRTALTRRRCLIPADGFYEWRREPDGKTKTPMYITIHGGELFGFAALWDTWQNPKGERVQSCTIITTAPNSLMASIHDRMPAIVPRDRYDQWLAPDERSSQELLPLLQPYSAHEMTARPASRLVNSPKNEGPELLTAEPPPAGLF